MTIIINTTTICEFGDQESNFSCEDCGSELERDCICVAFAEELCVYCAGHNEIHEVKVSDIKEGENLISFKDEIEILNAPEIRFYSKCRHYNMPVNYPNGVKVYASSLHSREMNEPSPDFALYLDYSWNPTGFSSSINWPDWGIPSDPKLAVQILADAYKKARDGKWVEVGCIGGHGRTGTVLACMGVLAGMLPKEAINFIRTTYCDHAIESEDQEWFVYWMAAYVNGGMTPSRKIWNNKTKSEELIDPIYYRKGFDWENYIPSIQGNPPKELVESTLERYFMVPYTTPDGKSSTYIVREGEKEYEEIALEFLDQEAQKSKGVK